MKGEVTERQMAEAQWSMLLKAALDAILTQLKDGDDFKIGAGNQTLEQRSYATMIASAVERLHAQGDLMLQKMPDQQYLKTACYTQWRPIADKESVNFLECECYLFSDSVLKLGKKGTSKWESYYEEAIKWMQKEAGLRMRTIHGKNLQISMGR